MSNKSEPARVRELATQLIKLHGETANTYGDDALWYSAAALRRCANRCENTHPAPALTADSAAQHIINNQTYYVIDVEWSQTDKDTFIVTAESREAAVEDVKRKMGVHARYVTCIRTARAL